MTFNSDNIQQASGGIDDIISQYAPPSNGGSQEEGGTKADVDAVRGETQDAKPVGGSPQAVEPNIDSLLGDRYKSVNDIAEALKRAEKFTPDVESEYLSFKEKAERLNAIEDREKALKDYNPYKNPNFYRLDKLMSENPDSADIYQRLVFGNVTDIELIKLDLLNRNPEVFKDNPDALQRKIERLFPGLNNSDPEDQEYQDAYTDMRLEASKIRKELMSKFESIEVPNLESIKQKDIQKASEHKQSWAKGLSKIREELKSISVRVTDEKNKIGLNFFEIDIPESDAKNLAEIAENYLVQNRIPYTDESFEMIKDYVSKYWILENLERYTTEVAERASRAKDGKWREIVHHPGKPSDKPVLGQEELLGTEEDAMSDIRKSFLGQ